MNRQLHFEETRDALNQVLADLACAAPRAEVESLPQDESRTPPCPRSEDGLKDSGDLPAHDFTDDELEDFGEAIWEDVYAEEVCIRRYGPI